MSGKIEWCDRHDWNPIRGCTRVSPGCGGPGPHGGCYAEAIAGRFSDPGQAFHGFATRTSAGGRWTGRVELLHDRLTLPLKWKKPARIFASSTSDIFHEKLADEEIDQILAVMALASHHTFQVLTKRADRMRRYFEEKWRWAYIEGAAQSIYANLHQGEDPSMWLAVHDLPNAWFGVSVEDQTRADERREDFRETPAAVKFVSYEPALGGVDWTGWEFVNQIISGGESGPRARPSHPNWHRATRDFCAANGIAYFLKQWGNWAPTKDDIRPGDHMLMTWPEGTDGFIRQGVKMRNVGKKAAGRLLDGVQHDGMPA